MSANEFSLELARPEDDPAIRRLLATNPIPGQITVTYEREPNYFLGCDTMGHDCQVVVARHLPSGDVAGVGCRAIRLLYVNGKMEEVGYLSQLRVAEPYRGRWLVPQAFQALARLHADGRVQGYLATIIEGNDQADQLLVRQPRRAYPAFRPLSRLLTLALILRGRKSLPATPYDLSSASPADLGTIVAFMRRYGAARQFFPAYTEADFLNHSRLTRDFCLNDLSLAWHQGELAGVMGLWDQSAFKQSVVQGYGGALGRFRPLYQLGLRLIGARSLPAPGRPIRFAYASFICLAHNDPNLFNLLLKRTYNLAAERGFAYLMLGLAENDPLLPVARRFLHIPYHSRLYSVCWPEDGDWHNRLDGRVPYVEIAAL